MANSGLMTGTERIGDLNTRITLKTSYIEYYKPKALNGGKKASFSLSSF